MNGFRVVNNRINSEAAAIHPFRRITASLARFGYEFSNGLKEYHVPFSERRVLLVTVDSLLVFLTAWGSHLLGNFVDNQEFTPVPLGADWYWLPLYLGGWWLLASLHDLYDIPSSYQWTATVLRFLSVGTITLILALITGSQLRFFAVWLLLALPALALWRLGYIRLSQLVSAPRRILIFGLEKRAQAVAQLLTQTPRDYQVLGFIADRPTSSADQRNNLTVLGQAAELPDLVQKMGVDEVVVTTSADLTEDIFQLLITCQLQGAKLSWMPDIYEQLYHRIPVQYIDPTWALYAIQGQSIFNRWQRLSKRALDLAIVFFSLPTFALLLPLLSLAIRIDSRGPIFYRQVRSGRGGKPFSIIKFRTMGTDAEQDGKARWATEDDPRVTRVGRFLRKTRLDELPQILNILKGEMSFVGPRPERPEFVSELCETIPFYNVRLMVKPGLTGWAQIHADYGNSVDDALLKLQYDFYYIRYWSLWMDLYTAFKTVYVVLRFKGL